MKNRTRIFVAALVIAVISAIFLLVACTSDDVIVLANTTEPTSTAMPTITPSPTSKPTPEPTSTPEPTPTPTPEPEHFIEGNYEYYIQNGGATIVKYCDSPLYESIPNTLGGYPVVEIGDEAFSETELHISTLPNTVTTIGDRAFASGYHTITDFVLPNSVTSVGEEAFSYVENLTLSKNLSYMGVGAFSKCDLKKLTIPEGVTYIGEEAFYYNNWGNVLESVSIPSSVSYIGANAFTQHFASVDIKISPSNAYYKMQDGALLSKDGTVLYAYYYDENRNTYTVPDGVTTIAREAFNLCYNTKVVIPASVTNIEEGAFSDNSVSSIEVSSENQSYKMENNALLTTDGSILIAYNGRPIPYEIPNTVKRIGVKAFSWNGELVDGITIPDSVTSIGDMAFEATDIRNIVIPSSVKEIGKNVFRYCRNLRSVTLNETFSEITEGMFRQCSALSEINIPKCVTSIGDYAFSGTAIANIDIPQTIHFLGNGIFSSCDKLTEVTLPEGISSVGNAAFYNCPLLTNISIPDSVEYIGNDVFSYSGLKTVKLPDDLVSIGDRAFRSCDELTGIEIPERITHIGSEAFRGCYLIKNVVLPKSINYIGPMAFSQSGINEIFVPGSVKFIGQYMFAWCENLTTITIESGVQNIGDYAFHRCLQSSKIIIPASVTNIGINAFGNVLYDLDYGLITIYTTEGSYASQYANEHGIPCVIN
ncbi:MAG: leucine-rich repeat domain-containing protein [Clostridiaceae bacterium]